jgi:glycosyltransferase involved in cell wall biosynthesis
LAISQHSARTYRRFIATPNDLPAPTSHAYLPNFLKERADMIGEMPTDDLDGQSFVVYCSSIEIRKNHELLLYVWDRLRQELSPDRLPILVFAGGWGWGTETVQILSQRNWRLRNHLRVLGPVSDAQLIWLYRNARFTVFPSLAEGFGLGAAESLSFGTPVVVSDCPALLEASEGLMPAHNPHDFPAWYREIHSLVTDDTRLEELCAGAKQYRGPAYHEFAAALRDVAREAVTRSSGQQ